MRRDERDEAPPAPPQQQRERAGHRGAGRQPADAPRERPQVVEDAAAVGEAELAVDLAALVRLLGELVDEGRASPRSRRGWRR